MVFIVLSLLILLYGIYNYKKGFMLYIISTIFSYPVSVFKIAGFSVSTTIIMALFFFSLYIFRNIHNKRKDISTEGFPFKLPLILLFVSLLITPFFAYAGFSVEFARSLTIVCRSYLLIWIMWDIIEDDNDFSFAFKAIIVVMVISCLYGIYEYTLSFNPLLNFKHSISDEGFDLYSLQTLRGYRLTSVFEHPIGAGMTMGLYSIFIFVEFVRYKEVIPFNKLAIFTAILCIPCVLLTKMRASVVFTIIASLCLISPAFYKKKRFYAILLIFLIVIPFIYLMARNNPILSNVVLSIFNSDYQTAAGGSNSVMRFSQLKAVYELFKLSPIGGLGETFKSVYSSVYTQEVLGLESIWFEQMAMHGAVGVIANIVLMYFTVIKIPMKYRSVPAFTFGLAYWVTYTLTSTPSFRIIIFFLIEFYFIKKSEVYRKSLKGNENSWKTAW